MKAQELRIGNWIEHNQNKKDMYTTVQPSTFSVNIEQHFKPIPLTEEWLVRFGFEIDQTSEEAYLKINTDFNNGSTFSLDCFIADYSFMINERSDDGDSHTSFIPKKLKYVHQLQNLYFALTGDELTIKQQ